MPTRRDFITTIGASVSIGALSSVTVLTQKKSSTVAPLDAYPSLERQLRTLADATAKPFTAGQELRLDASSGAYAASTSATSVTRGQRGQLIAPNGLLTFAIDVSEPAYVSGELLLVADADLRPGLRAYVLCDTTLVGAPMIAARDWGTTEVTAPAPRVTGLRASREIRLRDWLLPAGRHYLTVAGPHLRAAGSFQSLTLRPLSRAVRDPLYSFAFISDTHLYGKRERLDWMNRKMGDATGAEFRRTLEALSREPISFVMHGGDMTETAVRGEFEEFAGILASQSLPVYACLGNHDVYLDTSRRDALELLGEHFPGGALDYTFSKAPVRFVVMDVEIEKPDALARKQDWLRRTLEADRRTPTIFVWHYAPYNRGGLSSCGFRMFDWSELGKRALLDILQGAPNVFATLNGHDHWDEVNYLGGIAHVQNAAFVEWPNTYRVVRVYSDRIEWEVRQVANRGYVRESCVPEKALSWMIATRETDLTGEVPLRRARTTGDRFEP